MIWVMYLEELYTHKKNLIIWKKVLFKKLLSTVKQELSKQILLVLKKDKQSQKNMVSLEKASSHIQMAKKLWSY